MMNHRIIHLLQPAPALRRLAAALPVLAAAVVALVAGGCAGGIGTDPELDRQEIEATIREYLPLLAQAYATGNVKPLQELTVEKEVSRIWRRADELADSGRIFEADFKDVTFEKISTWKHVNAVVTTLEVWDVRSYAAGSHSLLGESIGQRNRVKYQLKRKDHGWVILYRERSETLDT